MPTTESNRNLNNNNNNNPAQECRQFEEPQSLLSLLRRVQIRKDDENRMRQIDDLIEHQNQIRQLEIKHQDQIRQLELEGAWAPLPNSKPSSSESSSSRDSKFFSFSSESSSSSEEE